MNQLISEKNRRASLAILRLGLDSRAKQSVERLIASLEEEIGKFDDEIKQRIENSPAWKQKDELLQSVPGVGPKLTYWHT